MTLTMAPGEVEIQQLGPGSDMPGWALMLFVIPSRVWQVRTSEKCSNCKCKWVKDGFQIRLLKEESSYSLTANYGPVWNLGPAHTWYKRVSMESGEPWRDVSFAFVCLERQGMDPVCNFQLPFWKCTAASHQWRSTTHLVFASRTDSISSLQLLKANRRWGELKTLHIHSTPSTSLSSL